MAGNDQPATEVGKRKDNRRTFSVSKGFVDVHDILDNLPDNEMSRFVCEAIRHYHQVKNNPNWMGEQLQEIFNTQAQLQQMLAGFGNVSFPPSHPFAVQPMQYQQIPNQPINQFYQQPVPQEQIQIQNPDLTQSASTQSATIETELEPSLPHVVSGEILKAEQVVAHSMKQVAVSKQPLSDEELSDKTGSTTTKQRKKSQFGASLINRSQGKVDK